LFPVFGFTWDEGYSFTNTDGTTWSVPDQLQAFANPKLISVANSAFCETYDQWITETMNTFSFNIGISTQCQGNSTPACGSLNFKYNHESYQYKNQLQFHANMASFSEMQWTQYTLQTLMPPFALPLYSEFATYLNSLPAQITSPTDQAMYSRLVEYWGTHISMSADMGAFAHVSSFGSDSYVQNVTQSWAASQWNLNFDLTLFDLLQITGGAGGFHNKSQIHIAQQFLQNTKSYSFFRGGDTGLANSSQVEWLASTIATPAWVHTRLMDLSAVVPLTSPDVANNIDATVNYYLKEGTLPVNPVDIQPYLVDTYPRATRFYVDNWPMYFIMGKSMPQEHRFALEKAGRLHLA
jgi:hypothetical protein